MTTPGVSQSEGLGSVKRRDQCLSDNNYSVNVFQSLFILTYLKSACLMF